MKKIVIKWGQVKEGYVFGSGSYASNSRKKHLVAAEPFNTMAVCGVNTLGTSEFSTGWLCADCAKTLSIKTPDDFDVLDEEYEWGLANTMGQQDEPPTPMELIQQGRYDELPEVTEEEMDRSEDDAQGEPEYD